METLELLIVRIERAQTQPDGRRLWRLFSATGQQVNIFENLNKPIYDSWQLFDNLPLMDEMQNGQSSFIDPEKSFIVLCEREYGSRWWQAIDVQYPNGRSLDFEQLPPHPF